MINRKFFFDYARSHLFGGSLKQGQVNGLTTILDYWDGLGGKTDDRWLAYALATAHHETDCTFRGTEEYGKGKGREYGKTDPETGKTYYGRGLVQLAWRNNYKTISVPIP